MRQSIRTITVFVGGLSLVAGCSHASRSTRVSSAPPDTGPAVSSTSQPSPTTAAAATPIPGHPPVTTTGVVAKFDPASGVLLFQDGRAVTLTNQSQVLEPRAMQPLDPSAIRPTDRVVVHNALPIGVRTGSKASKRQKVGTVASVNRQQQSVQLTDGSVVRVTPSTNMHMGADGGAALVLTDLRPGDEIVIVMTEVSSGATTSGTQRAAPPPPPAATSQPSALPSQATITGSPSDPTDTASELMVFREAQAP